MKALIVILSISIFSCSPILAKRHFDGVGTWIVNSELVVGNRVILDAGFAGVLEKLENLPALKPKKGYVIYFLQEPWEDRKEMFTFHAAKGGGEYTRPKVGGKVIDFIYVSIEKEHEFKEKVCTPTKGDLEFSYPDGVPNEKYGFLPWDS